VTLKFLCDPTRLELTQKPEKAINCWQNGFDTGHLLCNKNMWQQALPHLGCAFETSEIMLTTKAVEHELAYEIFTSSASSLIEGFFRLDHVQQCHQIYWKAVKRLTREYSCNPEQQTCISAHLESLYRQIQPLGSERNQPDFGAAFMHHYLRTAAH
jgi:hypothetical protein